MQTKESGGRLRAQGTSTDDVLEELRRVNPVLSQRISEYIKLLKPDSIRLIHGKQSEQDEMINALVSSGSLIRLNEKTYPNSYLYRSNPNDVARTEERTFVCSKDKLDSGVTNNWIEPEAAKKTLHGLLDGSMKGKTLYIVPYMLGPTGSPISQVGIELTSNPYVVANLMKITQPGDAALAKMQGAGPDGYVLGVHSSGTLDQSNKYICHFPEERLIISVNTDYGGNALLSKKCHALRIASATSKSTDSMAEHMMAIEVKAPDGKTYGITGAFPSASGKTNLAMVNPPKDMKGWEVSMLSDDIVWMRVHKGSLFAINPESGFFGVAPGTNSKSNANAMEVVKSNTIFTNVALTDTTEPWWEGMGARPAKLTDWQGRDSTSGQAAHPNSRFTTPLAQYKHLSSKYYDAEGLKVDAILFGGRRQTTMPLVFEAFSWEHGVLIGAMLRAETTAAAAGKVGVVRNDPMAMRPFCGYNIGDYFQHWLDVGDKLKDKPKVFNVNWFRTRQDGSFMWPGFGDNMRVLKWVIDRRNGITDNAVWTPIGWIPDISKFDKGAVSEADMKALLRVERDAWLKELDDVEPFFKSMGDRFPKRLWDEFHKLRERLQKWNP